MKNFFSIILLLTFISLGLEVSQNYTVTNL